MAASRLETAILFQSAILLTAALQMKAASLCDSSPFHSHRKCGGKLFIDAIATASSGELPYRFLELPAILSAQLAKGEGRPCHVAVSASVHRRRLERLSRAPSRSQALGLSHRGYASTP